LAPQILYAALMLPQIWKIESIHIGIAQVQYSSIVSPPPATARMKNEQRNLLYARNGPATATKAKEVHHLQKITRIACHAYDSDENHIAFIKMRAAAKDRKALSIMPNRPQNHMRDSSACKAGT
jgi:hypothetical protein